MQYRRGNKDRLTVIINDKKPGDLFFSLVHRMPVMIEVPGRLSLQETDVAQV